jgi:hypothetical protein
MIAMVEISFYAVFVSKTIIPLLGDFFSFCIDISTFMMNFDAWSQFREHLFFGRDKPLFLIKMREKNYFFPPAIRSAYAIARQRNWLLRSQLRCVHFCGSIRKLYHSPLNVIADSELCLAAVLHFQS